MGFESVNKSFIIIYWYIIYQHNTTIANVMSQDRWADSARPSSDMTLALTFYTYSALAAILEYLPPSDSTTKKI